MTIQIMIVEDDLELRDQYRTLIQGRNTLSLAAETDSVEEALRILQTMEIDAMILDLELPGGSGILLLEEMQKLRIPKPFIAVVTNVVSQSVYQAIRMLGADYICAKGERGFSLNVPISIIEISAPYQKKAGVSIVNQDEISRQTRIDIYKRRIEDELLRLGFSSKLKGTVYCQKAILYIMTSDKENLSATKDIYPYVAKECRTNVKNVERSIRAVIEKVWKEQDIRKLKELYPYDCNTETGRPTNTDFLYGIAKKINRQ